MVINSSCSFQLCCVLSLQIIISECETMSLTSPNNASLLQVLQFSSSLLFSNEVYCKTLTGQFREPDNKGKVAKYEVQSLIQFLTSNCALCSSISSLLECSRKLICCQSVSMFVNCRSIRSPFLFHSDNC